MSNIVERLSLSSNPLARDALSEIQSLTRERDEARVKALEEAAAAIEQHDRAGRDWIPGSLWDSITREASGRIRALASKPEGDT